MDKDPKSLSSDWVRCQSKSRPDKSYMFNKKTGKTIWCSDAIQTIPQKTIFAKNVARTPAQDRLKRLQSNLAKRKLNVSSPGKERDRQSKKLKETKNETSEHEEEIPTATTSKTSQNQKKESHKSAQSKDVARKNSKDKISESQKHVELKFVIPKKTSSSTKISSGEEKLSSPSAPSSSKEKVTIKNAEKKTIENPVPQSITKVESTQSDKEKKPVKDGEKPGIMSMVKGFCNKLLNRATKQKPKWRPHENKERIKNISANSKPSFKAKQPDITSTIANRGVLQANENAIHKPPVQVNVTPITRTVSSPIPVPNRGANARLQLLRNSLQAQQNILTSTAPSSDFSFVSEAYNVSSIGSPNASTSDCEPMDWQTISEEPSKSITISSQLLMARSANSSGLSEHYGTVNENLLRLAANSKVNQKWKKKYFYFVVDTNVFINTLTFVEDLMTMKLSDTMGTVIYVPYCVLQELDKLKIRSPSESIKIRSARAIKFLNKSLEEKSQNIQAQSAADETLHLIRVSSPDDSILNCCLQVKKNVDNIILLTEDNNLQNKALSSDVLVSTKSDLISKHTSLL